MKGAGCRMQGEECRGEGLGLRVCGFRFQVSGVRVSDFQFFSFRFWGSGFGVWVQTISAMPPMWPASAVQTGVVISEQNHIYAAT